MRILPGRDRSAAPAWRGRDGALGEDPGAEAGQGGGGGQGQAQQPQEQAAGGCGGGGEVAAGEDDGAEEAAGGGLGGGSGAPVRFWAWSSLRIPAIRTARMPREAPHRNTARTVITMASVIASFP